MELDTLTSQRNKPGLRATKKLWWAKEITPDYHVAGGLIERWMKYASEGGFKTLISLFSYSSRREFGSETLPSSSEAENISEKAGLRFLTLLDESEKDGWCCVKTIDKLDESLTNIDTPVLIFCDDVYKAAFVTLLAIVKKTKYDSELSEKVGKITSERFYRIALGIGFDFTSELMKNLVSEVLDEPVLTSPPKPDFSSDKLSDYWLAHYVHGNWYTAGQIRTGHIKEIENAGFLSVVNMREGVTTDEKPSQEIVTLLNITDNYPTYGESGKGNRQQLETLQDLVINPERDPSYIATEAEHNYESRNHGEFGDDVGYNEDIEKGSFEKSGFPYYHMPVGENYSAELFGQYKDKLMELGQSGPVLVHCASARRVAYLTVLAAAVQHDKDLHWALKRAKEIGFEVTPQKTKDIYEMYCAHLPESS